MSPRQASRADPLTPQQRRRNMAAIRAANTKPEMLVRRGLHAHGLRYRLHDRGLPGTPDLVFRSARVAVFVHGCFWHGHDCSLGVRPRTNADFWTAKINRNRERDEAAEAALLMLGWRVATVWECALRGRERPPLPETLGRLAAFIRSGSPSALVLRSPDRDRNA
ncbi:patch repair protein [Phenylobacterium zucineum HLK1]|uniref:Patch repair protein n=1 Tax=Phenylobacterium zucineum (strain HLK1) TaxID=450851 RepID=B4RGD5_PHEZH|nr:very short patch repair endonuclease [Phenylobacterium zucineum]ACG78841.1 patch repair protein [Phenylobacterium zucineum HLK1]